MSRYARLFMTFALVFMALSILPTPTLLSAQGSTAQISIRDVNITEGNSGTQLVGFIVDVVGTVSATTINVTVSPGTANAGEDYTGATSFGLVIGPSVTNDSVSFFSFLEVIGDTTYESNETVNATIISTTNPNVTVVDGLAVVTILDDDSGISFRDASITEGNSGTQSVLLTVDVVGKVAAGTQVYYTITAGSASAGSDYTAVSSNTLLFAQDVTNGNTSFFSSLEIIGDTTYEPDETIILTITSISDSNVAIIDSAYTVTITNDDLLPSLTATDDSYSTTKNSALNIAAPGVLGNDTGGTGTYSVTGNGSTSNGTVTVNSDGSFSYTPNTDYVGSDSFTYTLSDGSNTAIGTVSIAINDTPPPTLSATDDSYNTTKNSALNIAAPGVLGNDTGGTGTYSVTGNGSTSNGTVTVNSDGSFSYTPNTDYVGSDSFTYTLSDGSNTAIGTVSIAINDTPPPALSATDDSYNTTKNNSLNIAVPGVLGNDTGGTGTYSVSANGSTSNGMVTVNSDGSFSYTPNTDYVGSDSFTYTLSDGSNTAIGTVSIIVTEDKVEPLAPLPVTSETFRGPALPEVGARNLLLVGIDTPILSAPNGMPTGRVLLACQTIFVLESSADGQFGRVYSFGNSRGWIAMAVLIDVAEDYGQPSGQPTLPQCIGR